MSGGQVPLAAFVRRFSRGESVKVTPHGETETFAGKIARVQGEQYTISRDDGSRYYAHVSELGEV
jgi:ribosome maturation factor RimP